MSAVGKVEVLDIVLVQWKPASVGQTLRAGALIRTGDDGRVSLILVDETQIQLDRRTSFRVGEVPVTAQWQRPQGIVPAAIKGFRPIHELQRGRLWMRNQSPGTTAEVRTLLLTARLSGTEISVSAIPEDSVRITVIGGTVMAFNALGSTQVVAGEEVIARPGVAPQKQTLLTPRQSVQWTITVPPLTRSLDIPLLPMDPARRDAEVSRLESIPPSRRSVAEDVRLATLWRDSGQTRDAVELFESVLRRAPDIAEARTGLGWCRLDLGQPRAALDAFVAEPPVTPMNHAGRVAAYLALDELDEARAALDKGMNPHPGFALFRIQEALLELAEGELQQANETAAIVTKRDPGNALAWQVQALSALVTDEKAAALEAAGRAVSLEPSSASALVLQGYAYQAAFELESARASFERALALEPQHLTALLGLARIQFGSDDLDGAWQTIERAYAAAPENAEVLSLRGFLLLARQQLDEAFEAFQRASNLDPTLGDPQMGLGLAYMRRGEVDRALEAITMAALLEPQRAIFLSYWGKMLHEVRRFDEALDILDRARELDPNDPTPEFYRAIILRDLNRAGEALESFNRAVELNDNRAIYRSRFLLDKDLAARNVNLAILYNRLGFEAWAQNKALASIKQNYTNFDGHLFLAGALLDQPDRSYVFLSEAFLSRVLQPANINTFNNFNQYTSLFEGEDLKGTVQGAFGDDGTRKVSAEFFGSDARSKLALNFGGFLEETDGWRDSNYSDFRSLAATGKWQPTERDGVSFSMSRTNADQGDAVFPRFEIDSESHPDDKLESDVTRLELAYHRRVADRSDLLLSAIYLDTDTELFERRLFSRPLPTIELFRETKTDVERTFFQGQAQYMFGIGAHQLIAGTLQYRGNVDGEFKDTFVFEQTSAPPQRSLNASVDNDVDIGYQSYYLQDKWSISPEWTLEVAAYYDHLKNANFISDDEWTIDRFNPRLGVIFRPSSRETLRLAAFRYTLPFVQPRLDPTEIAGIPLARNAREGSVTTEADIRWEHEWSSGFSAVGAFHLERKAKDVEIDFNSPDLATSSPETRRGRTSGFDFEVNQLLTSRIGISGAYRYRDVEDEWFPDLDRDEHLFQARLRYIEPSGFSAALTQTYRRIDPRGDRSNEEIPITDFDLSYQFPGRRGQVSFSVLNVFDEEFNWITDRFALVGRAPSRQVLFSMSLNF